MDNTLETDNNTQRQPLFWENLSFNKYDSRINIRLKTETKILLNFFCAFEVFFLSLQTRRSILKVGFCCMLLAMDLDTISFTKN